MSDLKEKLPIYIRIVEGIKDAILNGELKEDEQLPSTTHLSKTYNLNIATVNKAINILVDQDLAYKKRGIGIFVKTGALSKLIKIRREEFREKYVVATLIEAKRLNITSIELQKIFKDAYDQID